MAGEKWRSSGGATASPRSGYATACIGASSSPRRSMDSGAWRRVCAWPRPWWPRAAWGWSVATPPRDWTPSPPSSSACYEQPPPSIVPSPPVAGALAGRDDARLVSPLVALRSRNPPARRGSAGAGAVERAAMGGVAAGAARLHPAPGGDARPVLPRAVGGTAPAGRPRVVGAARELADPG